MKSLVGASFLSTKIVNRSIFVRRDPFEKLSLHLRILGLSLIKQKCACLRESCFSFVTSDVPLPFTSGEAEPKFSTAKEKSSIIVEKKDETGVKGDEDKKDISGTSSGADYSILGTSPIQVKALSKYQEMKILLPHNNLIKIKISLNIF